MGKYLYQSLYLMKFQTSSQQLIWKRNPNTDVFCNFYQDFKNAFFIEALGAIASKSSSQSAWNR